LKLSADGEDSGEFAELIELAKRSFLRVQLGVADSQRVDLRDQRQQSHLIKPLDDSDEHVRKFFFRFAMQIPEMLA
jgi:hypothetical protein